MCVCARACLLALISCHEFGRRFGLFVRKIGGGDRGFDVICFTPPEIYLY